MEKKRDRVPIGYSCLLTTTRLPFRQIYTRVYSIASLFENSPDLQ